MRRTKSDSRSQRQPKVEVREPRASYGDQDENGIDLAALRRNLRLSPSERLQRMFDAAIDMSKVKRA